MHGETVKFTNSLVLFILTMNHVNVRVQLISKRMWTSNIPQTINTIRQ